jgi:hypothetical protein
MQEWLQSHYDVLKDFAGPGATMFAALVAATITAMFAFAQFRIAKAQKNIALDKLKGVLFEHRYKIYGTAKVLIEYILAHRHRDVKTVEATTIRQMYVILDEARFYFDDDVKRLLDKLVKLSEQYFDTLTRRELKSDDVEKWVVDGDLLAKYLDDLRHIYMELPSKFERALRFKELQK